MANQITPNPSVPSQVVAEVKFPKFINNLGIIPTSYKDSMSYYECLAWLCKYLEETVIPSVNENGEAVKELQNLYIELNSYVAHYFETLDVQEEINNKLDEMVEDGTLPEIVASYLQTKAVFGFDTVADMKNGSNLIEGSYARTLGFYNINDFGNGLYKIRKITNEDVIDEKTIIALNEPTNTLVAELIFNNEMNAEVFGINSLEELNPIILKNKVKKINFNKNYTILSTLNISNVELDFQNYSIAGVSDLLYHINMNENSKVKNAQIIFENPIITDLGNFIKISGNNIEISGCNITGFRGITCSESGIIENIKIDNNIFNCIRFQMLLHTATYNNLIITNNKQTIPQIWTSPTTAEICFCICNGFKWVPDSNEITSNILNTKYGNNYYISNNKFNQINARAFDISNAINVKIENNYCYNLPGDKTTVGISDDVFVLQFCKYSNISYNKVENSGENGCDLLSCQYCNVTNNEFKNCDGYSIDLNNADLYTRGWTDNSVTIDYIESSYNNIENNIIGIVILGVGIRNGRNNNIKGNTFYLESNNSDNVAVFLTGNAPFETQIGNYGTTVIDNLHDDTIRNYCNKSSLYIASNIKLGEADHYIYKLTVDNSTLATDNTLKMYDVVHNLKFNNARFYYIYDSKKYYLQPEYILNSDHNTYYGISNIQFFDYRCYVFLYKHFLPLQQSNRVVNFYNVDSGDLYIELW